MFIRQSKRINTDILNPKNITAFIYENKNNFLIPK